MNIVLLCPLILSVLVALAFAQNRSHCTPACDSDQVCEQVFNTNNQYQCVNRPSPAVASSSPIAIGCAAGCASGQTCQQVYNTNDQYECVATATTESQNTTARSSASVSPAATPTSSGSSGCNPACSAGQVCRQVYNTDGQYECVVAASPTAVAPSPAATGASNSTASTNTPTGCNPACSANQRCRQVFNTDDQYECVANTSSVGATATTSAASPAPVTNQGVCPNSASDCQECSNAGYCLHGGTCDTDGGCNCGLLVSSLHCNSTVLAQTASTTHSKSLSTGAITGIALGCVAGATLVLAALFAGIYRFYGRSSPYTRYEDDLYSPSSIS